MWAKMYALLEEKFESLEQQKEAIEIELIRERKRENHGQKDIEIPTSVIERSPGSSEQGIYGR